jgi:hypothetical protein
MAVAYGNIFIGDMYLMNIHPLLILSINQIIYIIFMILQLYSAGPGDDGPCRGLLRTRSGTHKNVINQAVY